MAKKTPAINSSSTADIAFLLLCYFLMTTTMGSQTGLSRRLPPMPDPNQKVEDQKVNRRNIIISDRLEAAPDGFEFATSIPKALELVKNEPEIFIMGGGMIYEQFLPMADRLYLTRIEKSFEADTYFPIINFNDWQLTDLKVIDDDPKIDCSYRFEVWERK